MNCINFKNFHFRYRGAQKKALEDISFQLDVGEFLVIMGPTEAGKSTLATCLNGLVPNFNKGQIEGEITVLGKIPRQTSISEMAASIGIVFQDFETQLFSTTCELEVAFPLENASVQWEEMDRRVNQNLEYVGLSNFRQRSPATLSGGQKQKLAIASVMAMEPQLLVLDEPTTDLDPVSKRAILEIIHRIRQQKGMTLVLVEHDTEEVLGANKILLLKDGKIDFFGPSQEVLSRVDLLERIGCQPLSIAKYFSTLGSKKIPLSLADALNQFRDQRWTLSDEKYSHLLDRDNQKSKKHGKAIIRCKDVHFSYPTGIKALDGINMEVKEGEILAIVGQNGSGKTTLVKHFNGLFHPSAGLVEIDDQSTTNLDVYELGKTVGYVFQNPDHQIFSQTVFDEVAYSLRLRGFKEDGIKDQVGEALLAVGLNGFEKEDPFTLTKSGRQRVVVAAVLASKPKIIILDEPTTGLDYSEQKKMMELIVRLNQAGSTIVIITHHMWVVSEYSDRAYVIKDGRVLLEGTTREVMSKESALQEAYLRPPLIVAFANRLDKTCLSIDELVYCTEGCGSHES